MKKMIPVIITVLLLAASAAVKAGGLEDLENSAAGAFAVAQGAVNLSRGSESIQESRAVPVAEVAETSAPGDVIVTVDRFTTPNDAPVLFAICGSEQCHKLQDKGYKDIKAVLIESTPAVRKYRIGGLKPGEYSLSGYNDTNGNGVLDTGLFGIPKEAVGFSRLDTGKLGGNPAWNSVKFTVSVAPVEIAFHLIHQFGL